MKFYFIVSEDMVKKHGMPECHDGTLSWKLNEKFHGYQLFLTPGEALNFIKQSDNSSFNPGSYAICEAHLDDAIVLLGLECALNGNSPPNVQVKVTELTWVKK